MTQPTALFLADWLEDQYDPTHNQAQAASELRRLHAELRRLQIDSDARNVHLSERMKDLFKVEAQRDALLEALKQIEPILARMYGPQAAELPPMQIVRAAIAQSEDNTNGAI